MMKKALQFGMAAVLAWAVTAPTVFAAIPVDAEHDHSAQVRHIEHSNHNHQAPCSHDDSGTQVDDDCACLCCPGHGKVLFCSLSVALAPVQMVSEYAPRPRFDFVAFGLERRIDRPPQSV